MARHLLFRTLLAAPGAPRRVLCHRDPRAGVCDVVMGPLMQLRDAVEGDCEAIRDIYNQAIPRRIATADLEPQTLEARRAWFLGRDLSKRPVVVATDGDDAASGKVRV
jgi:hypothetical protein